MEDVTLEDVRKSLVPAFVILNWEKCKVERINNVFKAKKYVVVTFKLCL